MLWVNHEYLNAMFVSQFNFGDDLNTKSKEQVEKEMYSVGGTLVRIRKGTDNKWTIVKEDTRNRRLTGLTKIHICLVGTHRWIDGSNGYICQLFWWRHTMGKYFDL